jgi:hypothetical protein
VLDAKVQITFAQLVVTVTAAGTPDMPLMLTPDGAMIVSLLVANVPIASANVTVALTELTGSVIATEIAAGIPLVFTK